MRRLIIAMGSLAFVAASPAQEALQCANPDVINALVFNAMPESKMVIRRTMPEATAGFGAPADFKLIGSGVRGQNMNTVVAWKTTQEAGKAFDNLLGFLFDQGWKTETIPQAQQLPVTVVGQQSTTAARLCRDGQRRNMQVREVGGVRYATIAGGQTNPPRACDVPQPQPVGFGNPMAAINAAQAMMPQFSLPATTRMSGQGIPMGSGGAGSVATSMRIESPDTAASLARGLAQQLAQQGWRRDAEWNGALSTGSTWTRNSADGKPYWGTLEILSTGANTHDIGFTVAGRPQ
jgi:hypothetical protein